MRFSAIALLTIAAIPAIQPAQAAPEAGSPDSSQNYAIPALPAPTTPSAETTAVPETAIAPEFSSPIAARSDLVVPATSVRVVGASEALETIIFSTIRTQIGGDTSPQQLQQDVEAILRTGLFASARVASVENPNGLDVTYEVEPVVLRSLQLVNATALTPAAANQIFAPQLGRPIDPAAIQQGIEQVNDWYKENGYILASVADARPSQNGVLRLEVKEGVVGNVNFRFLDKQGQLTDGRTNEGYIREAIALKPGQVFRVETAQQDLRSLYQLGLFQRADIDLQDSDGKVDVTYELSELPSRGFDAGGGYSENSGLFGSIRYNDQNVGGINHQLGLNLQVGTRDLQFDANYGRAYRATHPDRVGYNVNAFRDRRDAQTFNDITLADGSQPKESRFGGGVTLTQPSGEWTTSVGANYTRSSIRDGGGALSPTDTQGNQLSFSDTGVDDLVTLEASVSRDRRDNPINPTSGSIVRFSTEQSVPIGSGNILMNRITANYSNYTPVRLFGQDSPEVLAFNVQGGTTIGNLPPYQAFNLGGLNTVRGYENGGVASGRSYFLASAEYRVPIFDSPVSGVLFADFATDLGSGSTVPGEPGTVQGKPGTGFGYGTGVRVNSPLGVIRADLGLNDRGESRVHFGIGQRF